MSAPDISEAALADADRRYASGDAMPTYREAFAQYIQEVSDAAKSIIEEPRGPSLWQLCKDELTPFILPDPVNELEAEAEQIIDRHGVSFHESKQAVLAALKRGFELGGSA